MSSGRFGGYAQTTYGSQSEYGKSLSADQKSENFKKLTGKDLNLFDPTSSGVNLGMKAATAAGTDYQSYMNLFDPVYSGFGKGAKATGEYKLKADTTNKGFTSNNADAAAKLKESLLNKSYDEALANTYDTSDVSDEEAAKLGPADYGMKWITRYNKLTGETETTQDKDIKEESNFWRKYKKPLIQVGGGVLGFLAGGPMGAISGATLAGTVRDAYAARVDARKTKDYLRDWENDPANQPWSPTAGHLYQSAGEGVVDYDTKDIEKKKKGAYVKEGSK